MTDWNNKVLQEAFELWLRQKKRAYPNGRHTWPVEDSLLLEAFSRVITSKSKATNVDV